MVVALRIILILVFLSAILLQMVLRGLPLKELRRRARGNKDKKAARVYKLAVFSPSSELLLYLIAALCISPLVLLAAGYAVWLVFLVVLAIMWLTLMILPLKTTDEGWAFTVAAWLSPPVAILVSVLQPILKLPARWLVRQSDSSTGLYEKDDLLEFLKHQARQPSNRITESDLKTAHSALIFSDKIISGIMTRRSKITWVSAKDPIGPMIMDELHKTGQNRFPVVKEITKGATPEIVGALYIDDLLEHLEDKGRLRDIMKPGVAYINESQTLAQAVDGCLKSGLYLLVVVNNFEEVVGTVTIDQVLEQIVGAKLTGDIDNYHDLRAVASADSQQSDSQPSDTDVK